MNLNDKRTFLKLTLLKINSSFENDCLEYFLDGTTEKLIKRNEVFVENVRTHNEIGFIIKGIIKGFYIDQKGNELNARFVSEGGFATHYTAFIKQEPSRFIIKALKSTEILCFSYKHIQNCYLFYPSFERFGRLMAESIIVQMDYLLQSQQFDDAETRYKEFIKKHPDLYNRLITALSVTISSNAQKFTLSGNIKDSLTNEFLIGATIQIENTSIYFSKILN
jgi:CRP/FNR family transcriptional regulator